MSSRQDIGAEFACCLMHQMAQRPSADSCTLLSVAATAICYAVQKDHLQHASMHFGLHSSSANCTTFVRARVKIQCAIIADLLIHAPSNRNRAVRCKNAICVVLQGNHRV